MSVQKVEVIRYPPSDRTTCEGLAGRLEVSMVTASYLHIGSGREDIVRVVKGKPQGEIPFEEGYITFASVGEHAVIPGSSVKGNIRARLELSFKNKNGKVRSCFLMASPFITEPKVGQHGWRHYKIWGQVIKEDRGMSCDHTMGAPVCLTCNIFGTAGLRSLVEVSNFYGDRVSEEQLDLEYKTRLVAVPPNMHFRGSLTFHNLKPEELGLILLGMGLMESRVGRPVLLGRLKYRKQVDGRTFGRVRYELGGIRLSKHSQPLSIGERVLMEPSSYEKDSLDNIVRDLIYHVLHTYKGELQIVQEVDVVEKL